MTCCMLPLVLKTESANAPNKIFCLWVALPSFPFGFPSLLSLSMTPSLLALCGSYWTGSHSVARDGFEFATLLLEHPECWDSRGTASHLTLAFLLSRHTGSFPEADGTERERTVCP